MDVTFVVHGRALFGRYRTSFQEIIHSVGTTKLDLLAITTFANTRKKFIMADEERPVVAYLGPEGSYTHQVCDSLVI